MGSSRDLSPAPDDTRLEHPALVYEDVGEFLRSVVPFVADGVERSQPVFVAVGAEELGALRSEFGAESNVRLEDTREWQPNPATRLRAFHAFVTDLLRPGDAPDRIRLVGEPVWPAGPPEFVREWARYESALNAVLAPFPVSLVCTYPASRLEPSIVRDAHRTHPRLGLGGRSRASASFEEPPALLAEWTRPLAPVPPDAEQAPAPGDLAWSRAFVFDRATRAGFAPDRVRDLEIAVNEVLTNAISYAEGTILRVWRDGDHLVFQVDDRGPGIEDPLAGYRPPVPGRGAGRGLWLARQLVDLLQIVPTDAGTAVRLHARLPG